MTILLTLEMSYTGTEFGKIKIKNSNVISGGKDSPLELNSSWFLLSQVFRHISLCCGIFAKPINTFRFV